VQAEAICNGAAATSVRPRGSVYAPSFNIVNSNIYGGSGSYVSQPDIGGDLTELGNTIADARDRRAAAMGCMAQLGYNRGAKELMPRRPARFAEADIGRILEAARKARVQVRLELSHNGASALASVQAFEGRNIDGRFRQNRGAPGVIARCTPVS
jgi:hypothetical protein